MVANRMEPTAGTEEAAAATTAPAPAAGGGIKAWLPLVAAVVMMPILAFAMTQFVLVPRVQKALGAAASTSGTTPEAAPAPGKAATGEKKESATMNKLLVNVAGTMGARYLLVSLSVIGTDANLKQKMEDNDAQLRDMASEVLRTKTLADLEKPGARNLIRSELISGFNNILGGATVQEIYLTEFAIQ
jgi:flagellar FliL protein